MKSSPSTSESLLHDFSDLAATCFYSLSSNRLSKRFHRDELFWIGELLLNNSNHCLFKFSDFLLLFYPSVQVISTTFKVSNDLSDRLRTQPNFLSNIWFRNIFELLQTDDEQVPGNHGGSPFFPLSLNFAKEHS